MRLFLEPNDYNDVYASPQEYIKRNNVPNGQRFTLLSIEVTAQTTYCVKDGVALPETVSFPESLSDA